jgi:type I restriction enzyme S subunit
MAASSLAQRERRVSLRELIEESQNGLSKRSGDVGEDIDVLRLADISGGAIDESAPRAIRLTDKERAKYQLCRGDLLCIRVNGSKSLVGRVVPFTSLRPWAYCDHFIRLRPEPHKVDFRYLAYYLNSAGVRRGLELKMVSSAGQHTVSQGTVLDLEVPLPPLRTQQLVVAEIEKQFSRLDEAVANLQRVKANLKRYRAVVFRAAVEGRLVAREAELARDSGRGYESGPQLLARVLESRQRQRIGRGNYKAPSPPTVLPADLLPSGWVWSTLDQVTVQVADVDHKMPKAVDAGVPYVSTKDFVGDSEIDFGNAKRIAQTDYEFLCRKVRPARGDILLSRYGTVGEVRRVVVDFPFQASYSVAIIKPVQGFGLVEYLDVTLRSELIQAQIKRDVRATAQPDLGLAHIRMLVVPLPPLAEQHRIVAEVDRRLSIVREVEAEVERNLKRAQALRQAVLARAFGA